ASVEELTKIPDVGPIVAESIFHFFKTPRVRETLKKFKEQGIHPKFSAPDTGSSALNGKTFVFTGELKTMTRPEAEIKVRDLGGKSSDSVSKKTNFVVVGENPGSKFKKAQTLGVIILSEKAFLDYLKKVS